MPSTDPTAWLICLGGGFDDALDRTDGWIPDSWQLGSSSPDLTDGDIAYIVSVDGALRAVGVIRTPRELGSEQRVELAMLVDPPVIETTLRSVLRLGLPSFRRLNEGQRMLLVRRQVHRLVEAVATATSGSGAPRREAEATRGAVSVAVAADTPADIDVVIDTVLSAPDLALGESLPNLARAPHLRVPEDLSTRASNLLKRHALTPSVLAAMTPSAIWHVRGCGTRSLREIVRCAVLTAAPEAATGEGAGSETVRGGGPRDIEHYIDLILERRSATIGTSLPSLASHPALAVPEPRDAKLEGVIARHGLTPGGIAEMQPPQLFRLRGLGTDGVRRLIRAAVLTAHPELRSGRLPSVLDGMATGAAAHALGTLAAWVTVELGGGAALDAILRAGEDPGSVPPQVRASIDLLNAYAADFISPSLKDEFDLGSGIRTIEGQFDERERLLLGERTMAFGQVRTLEHYGLAHGITRERVRQIQVRATRKLHAAVARSGVVTRTAARLRREIGIASPVDAVRTCRTLAALGRPVDLDAFPERLLLWLAGPYRLDDGWLTVREADDALRTAVVAQLATGGGRYHDLRAAVCDGGVPDEHADAWVARLRDIREMAGRVVRWPRDIAGRLEVTLSATGVPMPLDDLVDVAGTDHSRGTLLNTLRVDDRFMRVTSASWALSAWGYQPFRHPRELLADALGERGGEAEVESLVLELASQHSADEASLRYYVRDPMFTVRGGVLRFADSSPRVDFDRFAPAAELSPRVVRRPGAWAYRTTVTSEVLRGSGQPAASAFAHAIGMLPGDERRWETEHGPASIWWGRQATLGTVRTATRALGGIEGDLLFLAVSDDGPASYHLVPKRLIAQRAGDPMAALALALGCDPDDTRGPRASVGHALGFAEYPTAEWKQIEKRLMDRAEPELAELARRARVDKEGLVGNGN